jgi:hypothetical protein
MGNGNDFALGIGRPEPCFVNRRNAIIAAAKITVMPAQTTTKGDHRRCCNFGYTRKPASI